MNFIAPSNSSQPGKKILRTELMAQRKQLPPAQKQQLSHNIQQRLLKLLEACKPDSLLLYRSLPDEVDTTTLFGPAPYRIFAPVTSRRADMHWRETSASTTWTPGQLGVLEPAEGTMWSAETASRTILVCPLVGFDRRGHRIGMGLGCFDRWLNQHSPHLSQIIGLAFACQEAADIPAEAHDVPLNTIITENEVIECRNH